MIVSNVVSKKGIILENKLQVDTCLAVWSFKYKQFKITVYKVYKKEQHYFVSIAILNKVLIDFIIFETNDFSYEELDKILRSKKRSTKAKNILNLCLGMMDAIEMLAFVENLYIRGIADGKNELRKDIDDILRIKS